MDPARTWVKSGFYILYPISNWISKTWWNFLYPISYIRMAYPISYILYPNRYRNCSKFSISYIRYPKGPTEANKRLYSECASSEGIEMLQITYKPSNQSFLSSSTFWQHRSVGRQILLLQSRVAGPFLSQKRSQNHHHYGEQSSIQDPGTSLPNRENGVHPR